MLNAPHEYRVSGRILQGETGSDSGVPGITLVFPVSAPPPGNAGKLSNHLDLPDVFSHFVTKLTFGAQAQRGAVFDRQRCIVQFVSQNRLRMSGFEQVQAFVIEL